MSHELFTPLNGLMILAAVLQGNDEDNLTAKQVGYATMIRSAGTDLLRLLDDILQLAATGSSEITAEICDLAVVDLQHVLQRDFGHKAGEEGLSFSIDLAADLPSTLTTDPAILIRILSLLLANALKFTEHGGVTMSIRTATSGWDATRSTLQSATGVIAFDITDTGIGMTPDTQRDIFEDFVQGDGTSHRRYSGAGLGLSISRNLIRLLGGDITVTSIPEEGSTFTVYLPATSTIRTATALPVLLGQHP